MLATLPRRTMCYTCRGKGYIMVANGKRFCRYCHGTGRNGNDICRKCRGTKYEVVYTNVKCIRCGGKGYN